MNWSEIRSRIESGEDDRTEFKRGLGDLGSVGRTLCAFANGDGGLVLIGIGIAGIVEYVWARID